MVPSVMRFSDIVWPDSAAYTIRNASIPDCFMPETATHASISRDGISVFDVLVENGRIAAFYPPSKGPDAPAEVDLQQRQLWPTLIDVHTHLDRGHTVVRSPNRSGTFADALSATEADRRGWTREDLLIRMDFALRCAYAHGVSAIRTHLDSVPEQAERSWAAFREIRAQWTDRLALQAVSLLPIDYFRGEAGDRLAALVAQSDGILGAVTRAAGGTHGSPLADMDALLDRLFYLAAKHDLDVDLHVDETNDPCSAALPMVARATMRHGYGSRVTAGHCCSLAVQPTEDADRTLDLVAEAGIAIVTLPTVNMYLQDREAGRTPRWRGVTLVQEMKKRGIVVAAAGDNCRDCFHAYGDNDMVDTFRQAVRILHLDYPLSSAPALVGPAPSSIARLSDHGRLAVGSPARFVVFNARTLNEIVTRPQADRIVVHSGRRINTQIPDYSEFWQTEPAIA